MKISIFGLGYVGAISAACFADRGYSVTGVDPNAAKIAAVNAGQAPVMEKDLSFLTAKAVQSGFLKATADAVQAVLGSDISIICVGTPSDSKDGVDLGFMETTCRQIGEAIAHKTGFYTVIIRSTILPGTTRRLIIPILERTSGKKAGIDFGVCHNPEFLREGSAIFDFLNPERIVIGHDDARTADIVEELYKKLPGKAFRCTIEESEMLKYTENAWHATKVVFANEIGNLCKAHGVDSHAVMDIFCEDTRLNLSPYYMKPGFAFGGSCLPKDVRALTASAQELHLQTPLLRAILPSNDLQIRRGLDMIMTTQKKRIGILGISFKAGTGDLRESPLVFIAQHLLETGYTLRIFDDNIMKDSSAAKNSYIQDLIPKLVPCLSSSLEEVLRYSDVIVLGHHSSEFSGIATKLRHEHIVIDFVRIRAIEKSHSNYHGICW